MPKETEQRDKTERLDESHLEVIVNKCRAGVRRLKESRVTTLSLRSERWQHNISDVEWLSTSIVHDLRNPLGAIYAAAELLVKLDAGPTQVKRLANNIYHAAGRMRELVEDLNRVVRGDRPMFETCDIREVIATASDAASATTVHHNVQILLNVSEGIELPLIRSRMERVFFNLIVNSVEAMTTGGKLRIAARKTVHHVLIELEDTGPGIPRAIRDRLFEPFITAGKQDGLGLGLALCRQTLLNHGGDIWTEPAIGARFVIRLPLAPARSAGTSVTIGSRSELKRKSAAAKIGGYVEKASDDAAENAKKRGAFIAPSRLSTINWRAGTIGGQHQSLANARFLAGSDSEQERHMTPPAQIRILSVDCHPLVQEGIATTVNAQSDMLVVSTASSGIEGIRNHRDHRPDVTLMDLALPDMSGIDAMIAIRAESPEARIIILTTCEGDVQVRRALAAGARSYQLKKMAPPDLVKVIRDVYAGHRRVSNDLATHVVDHLGDEALTPREIEVLEHVAGGNRNRDIGERLFISEETVKVHVKHLMDKLGAKDRTQAFAIAVRRGIIQI